MDFVGSLLKQDFAAPAERDLVGGKLVLQRFAPGVELVGRGGHDRGRADRFEPLRLEVEGPGAPGFFVKNIESTSQVSRSPGPAGRMRKTLT